jgi:hypothetical protein
MPVQASLNWCNCSCLCPCTKRTRLRSDRVCVSVPKKCGYLALRCGSLTTREASQAFPQALGGHRASFPTSSHGDEALARGKLDIRPWRRSDSATRARPLGHGDVGRPCPSGHGEAGRGRPSDQGDAWRSRPSGHGDLAMDMSVAIFFIFIPF